MMQWVQELFLGFLMVLSGPLSPKDLDEFIVFMGIQELDV